MRDLWKPTEQNAAFYNLHENVMRLIILYFIAENESHFMDTKQTLSKYAPKEWSNFSRKKVKQLSEMQQMQLASGVLAPTQYNSSISYSMLPPSCLLGLLMNEKASIIGMRFV